MIALPDAAERRRGPRPALRRPLRTRGCGFLTTQGQRGASTAGHSTSARGRRNYKSRQPSRKARPSPPPPEPSPRTPRETLGLEIEQNRRVGEGKGQGRGGRGAGGPAEGAEPHPALGPPPGPQRPGAETAAGAPGTRGRSRRGSSLAPAAARSPSPGAPQALPHSGANLGLGHRSGFAVRGRRRDAALSRFPEAPGADGFLSAAREAGARSPALPWGRARGGEGRPATMTALRPGLAGRLSPGQPPACVPPARRGRGRGPCRRHRGDLDGVRAPGRARAAARFPRGPASRNFPGPRSQPTLHRNDPNQRGGRGAGDRGRTPACGSHRRCHGALF